MKTAVTTLGASAAVFSWSAFTYGLRRDHPVHSTGAFARRARFVREARAAASLEGTEASRLKGASTQWLRHAHAIDEAQGKGRASRSSTGWPDAAQASSGSITFDKSVG